MNPLDRLRRIAEIEFATIVVQTDSLGAKLRVLLTDASYVDVWASRKLMGESIATTTFPMPVGLAFRRLHFIFMMAIRIPS